jgi:hypothetical protein
MTDEREIAPEPAPRRRPWWQRVLIGLAFAVLLLGLLAVLLYNFGGMMPPSAEAKAQYASLVAAGQVPSAESRLHIPIPGCVCHSDDPVLQVEHSKRSLSQCMGCHGGSGAVAGR